GSIKMTRPSIYHSQGYTCAEALIKSYNEEHNTDIPISIGSGMAICVDLWDLVLQKNRELGRNILRRNMKKFIR
ncbi:hypothetical protein ACTPEF_26065, partial [Clostridioides difficile]